ncbi:MAG: N-acetyltransferase [Spirochaetales bacterium]|nr:N-acetyltransferase [Spirochaetales bacterium]
MSKKEKELVFQWLNSFTQIKESSWNELCRHKCHPFMSYKWFALLEDTNTIGDHTGWGIRILTVCRDGSMVAACPLFLKSHSDGEFSYDFAWQEFYQMLGLHYYPKIVGMSPFSPVPVYHFLVKQGENEAMYSRYCLEQIKLFCSTHNISGIHYYFTDPGWGTVCRESGYAMMLHHRYLWQNSNYPDFNAFLDTFNKNQRKNIRKEMQCLEKNNLTVRFISGNDITADYADSMYDFYEQTNQKYGTWSCLFLNRDFFKKMFQEFKKNILLIGAFSRNNILPDAMSFFILHNRKLYGRYWGSSTFIPHLHFTLCYYLPVKWAIDNNIDSFDPGVGAIHKSRRGFVSSASHSYHFFLDDRIRSVFDENIRQINMYIRDDISILNEAMPLKRKDAVEND